MIFHKEALTIGNPVVRASLICECQSVTFLYNCCNNSAIFREYYSHR